MHQPTGQKGGDQTSWPTCSQKPRNELINRCNGISESTKIAVMMRVVAVKCCTTHAVPAGDIVVGEVAQLTPPIRRTSSAKSDKQLRQRGGPTNSAATETRRNGLVATTAATQRSWLITSCGIALVFGRCFAAIRKWAAPEPLFNHLSPPRVQPHHIASR